MRVLDIAVKDLLRNLRNGTMIFIMFLLPLLTNGLIYFAFGGLAGGGEGFEMQITQVQVVNLDEPPVFYGGFSAGQFLVDYLQDEMFATLIETTAVEDEQSARDAVDHQEAGVAVIIPVDFTSSALAGEEEIAVVLYADPTLTLGPPVVEQIVRGFVDSFAGSGIATQVVSTQLSEHGLNMGTALLGEVGTLYGQWAQTVAAELSESGLLDQTSPPGEAESTDFVQEILSSVMTGMVVFYAFMTAAQTAQSIIREDENGTLARLFTTSTPRSVILGGKLVAVFVIGLVQVIVSMVLASLIFGLGWGQPIPAVLAVLGLVVASAGFGVVLMSFPRTTKQAGPVVGTVLPVTAMAGGLYTTGFTNMPKVFDTIALFTPQGWSLHAWNVARAGGEVLEVLGPAVVSAAFGLVLFAIGVLVLRRRFI